MGLCYFSALPLFPNPSALGTKTAEETDTTEAKHTLNKRKNHTQGLLH